MHRKSTPLQEQKHCLRVEMRARRQAGSTHNMKSYNKLRDVFMHHVKVEAGSLVASYCAFRDEMDPAFLTDALRLAGHKIALPVIVSKAAPLHFRLFAPHDELIVNAMGIREPGPLAPLVEPDILLVPLLAFDKQGQRLGYGGGFYDRTIAELRSKKTIRAIGIAFSWQEVEAVPIGPHDVKLDNVVTELNVF